MAEYYLQTKDLAVGYQGKALIHDINFGICKGEIVTLIGPNGSGKSTILKSITRQLRLVGGKVFFDDTSLMNISYKELSSRMAVVLTERIRTELMTCHDIVATGRYPYTGRLGILTAEDERIVDEAMAAVHAQEIGNRDFNAISDGQKQRIMLARAICQEPEIIVLDEPTSYLDIRYKLELLDILKRMAKEKGITVLMSLHEIDLAQKCADRIVCVRGEEIMAYGTPEEVFYEETIEKLYDLDNGSYNPLSGSLELKKTEGEPEVFVISSGGNGTPIYRKLQREGRPFAAGILYTNDVDGFCIVSSDSDFTRLVSRLRESGKMVIGMGENKTPEPFRKACDKFTILENLLSDQEPAAEKEVHDQISKEKIEDAIIKMVIENQNSNKESGLGEIGSRLVSLYPDFDVRSYGYNMLSKFLEEFSGIQLVKHGNYVSVALKEDRGMKEDIDAYVVNLVQKAGKDGMELSTLGNRVYEKYKDFKIRDYGYAQFNKYVKSVDHIEVKQDGTILKARYVK